ncbi:DNA polymerase IV [Thermodesulfobacteriota bacterium]
MFRHIIHIHIPAFAITVERVGRPELRDRPVVVAPPHSGRALILSVSPEARQEGIFKGMALGKAMKFCPDLTVLPPNPGLTEKGCQLLAKAVAQYTPIWEPSRPGHVYMDVTGTERLWGRAKDAACRIRREVRNNLSLPGAVGVAGNKMVSNIASRVMPSEGVLDVDHGKESAFMAPLRVDFLPGIGRVRRRILLEELKISLIRAVAVLDMRNLKLVFGRQAWVIHQRALGIDLTPVHPPASKPAVTESITLVSEENDDHRLLGILYSLVEKCSQRLRKRGLIPRGAGLMLRYSDHVEVRRQVSLPCPSFWDFDLYAPMEKLFFKACQRRTGVRFMRIRFRDLSSPSSQLSLFPSTPPDADKKVLMTRALDRIRERYGDGVIRYGRTA